MFGGYGLYLDGLMIGVVIDDGLYLKADEPTRAHFEAAGCAPFVYDSRQAHHDELLVAARGRRWIRRRRCCRGRGWRCEAALRKPHRRSPRQARAK